MYVSYTCTFCFPNTLVHPSLSLQYLSDAHVYSFCSVIHRICVAIDLFIGYWLAQ